jgi:hypothetical protein
LSDEEMIFEGKEEELFNGDKADRDDNDGDILSKADDCVVEGDRMEFGEPDKAFTFKSSLSSSFFLLSVVGEDDEKDEEGAETNCG